MSQNSDPIPCAAVSCCRIAGVLINMYILCTSETSRQRDIKMMDTVYVQGILYGTLLRVRRSSLTNVTSLRRLETLELPKHAYQTTLDVSLYCYSNVLVWSQQYRGLHTISIVPAE